VGIFYIILKPAEESRLKRQCSCFNWNLASTNRVSALSEVLSGLPLGKPSRELLAIALETREHAQPTIVYPRIAMPHCRSILVDDFVILLARSEKGIPWTDDIVNLIIMFISPVKPTGPQEHMELIKHLARQLKDGGAEALLAAGTATEAASILKLEPNWNG
jgi:mannitol/fructose-specific phosphotransferase system IIA component (Ntr-type)